MKIDYGNSGSSVRLMRIGSEIFVEKSIVNYTSRDLKSVEKQVLFGSDEFISAGVHPVNFLSFNKDKSILRFKMRYIDGLSGHNLKSGLNYFRQNRLCSILERYFEVLFTNSKNETVDRELFLNKFNEILETNRDKDFEPYIFKLKEIYTEDLWKDTIQFPLGQCHGDLTFSNMFLTTDKLYLIDFLHTFLESPLQDIVKLRQDFVYGWSARFENTYTQNILEVFGLKINYLLSEYRCKYPFQSALLEALCLLRIVPYITDETTKVWLIAALKRNIKETYL